MDQFFYILLAILGLSFLVFIHELGHFLAARSVGMNVETFSIGFGRPIVSWMRKGVKWQIGALPFGGFVKISGMEGDDVENGFYRKTPLRRIWVLIAGPAANILFTLLVFSVIWGIGGREKPFSEYTNIIGFVDPQSELYEKGVRPGDVINEYNGEKYTKFQDVLMGSVSNKEYIEIAGKKISYYTGSTSKFSYELKPYPDPRARLKEMKTIGVMNPARYLIVDKDFLPHAPMRTAGAKEGDRIVWANGELVFSLEQLSRVVNEEKVLVSFLRNGVVMQSRVDVMPVADFLSDDFLKYDFTDWGKGATQFIPFVIDSEGGVIRSLSYNEQMSDENTFALPKVVMGSGLQAGDKILAINGKKVRSGQEIVRSVQERQVLLAVSRGLAYPVVAADKASNEYTSSVNWKNVQRLTGGIGTDGHVNQMGTIVLLQPITPVSMKSLDTENAFGSAIAEAKKETSVAKRQMMMDEIAKQENTLVIGAPLGDAAVRVRANPFAMMGNVFRDMYRTLSSVVTGVISPKWMSGPVGIMQVMHASWNKGVVEAIYWLGLISLNLGTLNLLPIPVLDGGYIVMSLVEMITGRRLSQKAIQRLIVPFVVLLITFFLYTTYQDLSRLLKLW